MSISARAQERAGRQRWLNTKLASAAAADADAEHWTQWKKSKAREKNPHSLKYTTLTSGHCK